MFAFAALVGGLILSGCKGKTTTDTGAAAANEKVKVKVEKVQVQPVDQVSEYTGTIEAYKKNNISPNMPLRIKSIRVEVGDRVSAGQLLATMDDTQYQQSKLQLDNLEIEYQRIKNLYEAGAVSQQDFDNMKAQVDVSKTAIENLRQNIQLTSPISGIVTARNYDNGDMFSQYPVVTIMQMQPVKVQVNIQEVFFPQVKKGMKVAVKLDTYPDKVFEGTVSLIYPTIDQLSRTFTVEVSIPNKDMLVRPGMFARVEVNYGKESRVVVPDLAIQKQEGSNDRFVFVIENGVARRKTVMLGARLNDKYEVVSGISDGDDVVVAGQSRLMDKVEVEVEK